MMKLKMKNNLNQTFFNYSYGKAIELINELNNSYNYRRLFVPANNNVDVTNVIENVIKDIQWLLREDENRIPDLTTKNVNLAILLDILSEKYRLEEFFKNKFRLGVLGPIIADFNTPANNSILKKDSNFMLTLLIHSLAAKRFTFANYLNDYLVNNSFLFGETKYFFAFYSIYIFSLSKINYIHPEINKYASKTVKEHNKKWCRHIREIYRCLSVDEIISLPVKFASLFNSCTQKLWYWPNTDEMYTVSNYEMSVSLLFDIWLDLVNHYSVFIGIETDEIDSKVKEMLEELKTIDFNATQILFNRLLEKKKSNNLLTKKNESDYLNYIYCRKVNLGELSDNKIARALFKIVLETNSLKLKGKEYVYDLDDLTFIFRTQADNALTKLGFSSFLETNCLEISRYFLVDLDTLRDFEHFYSSMIRDYVSRYLANFINGRSKNNVLNVEMLENNDDLICTTASKYSLLDNGYSYSKILMLDVESKKEYLSQTNIVYKKDSLDLGARLSGDAIEISELSDQDISSIINSKYKTSSGVYKYYDYEGSNLFAYFSYEEVYKLVKRRYCNVVIKILVSFNVFNQNEIFFVKKETKVNNKKPSLDSL